MVGTKTSSVKAASGKWEARMKGDQVVEFVGTFDRSDADDAMGTLRFLHNSRISNTVNEPREPERYSNAYVVRLRRADGDHMEKFETWAMKHDLLPKLRRQQEERDWAEYARERDAKKEHAFAYDIAPTRFVQSTIERMDWQLLEAGYPTRQQPHAYEAMVVATGNPKLAFQVAFYLQHEGYIDREQFTYINHEAKAQMALPEEGREFRIAVSGAQLERFMKDFPAAGNPSQHLDKAWLARLDELSAVNERLR